MVPGVRWRGTAVAALTPQAATGPGLLRLQISDFNPLSGTSGFGSVRLSLTGSVTTGRTLSGVIQPLLVSRDGDTFHVVSAKCTHEGCVLPAFGATKTTTCLCHSSRFSFDGTRISGLASGPLDAYTVTRDGNGLLTVEIPELDAFDIAVSQVVTAVPARLALTFDSVRNVEYEALTRTAVDQPWLPLSFATSEQGVATQTVFKGTGNAATLYVEATESMAFVAVAVRVRSS